MKRSHLSLAASLFFLALASSGCHMVSMGPPPTALSAAASQSAERNTCTVEFRTSGGKVEGSKQIEVSDESHVQEMLSKSGAFKKYSRLNVELVRTTPKGNPHTMSVTVDSAKRRVEPQFDYHVRAGDKLVIIEDPTTALDDVLDNFGLPSKKKVARTSVSG